MDIPAITDTGSRVGGAIRQAAQTTGADFDYLVKTAAQESSFDPNATARTSSATGLFQFIDQTWLATVKQSGAVLGYGRYADAITRSSSGGYGVSDPGLRREILNLRYDPTANALFAGVLTRSNAAQLAAGIGRRPTDGELYAAHVLGVAGAAKLISAAANSPQAGAAHLFPGAARANHSIFYDAQGTPRTTAQVYALLSAKQDRAVAAAVPPLASTAAATPAPPVGLQTDPAGEATPAMAASAYAAETRPAFTSLFQDDRPGAAASPVVSQLWGQGMPATPPTAAARLGAIPTAAGPGGAATSPDLFQFLRR